MRDIFRSHVDRRDLKEASFQERSDLLVEKALDFEIQDRMKYALEGREHEYDRRSLRKFHMSLGRARRDYILVRSTFNNAEFSKVLGDERYAPSDRKLLLELETRDLSREREREQGMSRDRQ